jgi:hypothetical protein
VAIHCTALQLVLCCKEYCKPPVQLYVVLPLLGMYILYWELKLTQAFFYRGSVRDKEKIACKLCEIEHKMSYVMYAMGNISIS